MKNLFVVAAIVCICLFSYANAGTTVVEVQETPPIVGYGSTGSTATVSTAYTPMWGSRIAARREARLERRAQRLNARASRLSSLGAGSTGSTAIGYGTATTTTTTVTQVPAIVESPVVIESPVIEGTSATP